jgi:hypothetical protein
VCAEVALVVIGGFDGQGSSAPSKLPLGGMGKVESDYIRCFLHGDHAASRILQPGGQLY